MSGVGVQMYHYSNHPVFSMTCCTHFYTILNRQKIILIHVLSSILFVFLFAPLPGQVRRGSSQQMVVSQHSERPGVFLPGPQQGYLEQSRSPGYHPQTFYFLAGECGVHIKLTLHIL